MEQYADLFKRHVLHFKLELCCFMATVRSGVLAFGCLNMAIGVLTLMFFAEESFEPLLLKVLKGISSDPPNYGPSCMIVYAIELGSNVLMLCGMIRNDLVLLRVYLYYSLGVLTAALMVYSVMFSAQTLTVECLILASIGYQIYIILLVRSAMVEIKQTVIRDRYRVNYRQSSLRYSRPGSRDKYSVVIEPYRPRGSLVPLLVKETYVKPKITEEVVKEPIVIKSPFVKTIKEAPIKEEPMEKAVVTVHSPKAIEANEEVTKETVTTEVVVKEGEVKEVKEEIAKETKENERKRKRSFFGRKEKVKKNESLTTNDEK